MSYSLWPHGLSPTSLLCMGFSRQDYWSRLPFSPPGDLPNLSWNSGLLHCGQILYCLSHHSVILHFSMVCRGTILCKLDLWSLRIELVTASECSPQLLFDWPASLQWGLIPGCASAQPSVVWDVNHSYLRDTMQFQFRKITVLQKDKAGCQW